MANDGTNAMIRSTLSIALSSALIMATAVGAKPPLAATALSRQPDSVARHAMVAAANPLAVAAGVGVLKRGGSAVDAAVAIQAVLGLVEPQSSGLGGGAFMLYYDAKSRHVTAYDGRETAPAGATADLFRDQDGHTLAYPTAVLSGRATGVPGAVAMLALAHEQHGTLGWTQLFGPASLLAKHGFVVSPRLAGFIAAHFPQNAAPDVVRYFTKPDGQLYRAGDVLHNLAYAETLQRIAKQGAAGLLTGKVARDIVARLHDGALPSTITRADLAAYRPMVGAALCRPYRVHIICTPQVPSGGLGMLEALGILEQTDIDKRNARDATAWFQFAQASRLAYADRDRYVGDPAFVAVPIDGLLDPAYLAARAQLIGERAAPITFGTPKGAPIAANDATLEPGGTSHMVIVDRHGNVVSMTTTVESIFGSGRMVDGFFLNNQLTDFSFSAAQADGTQAANAPAAGKRPRSSMAPTIVLNADQSFYAAAGSPGGSAIQAYNLKVLVAMLDWKMRPQDAVSLPNLVAHGDSYSAEPFSAEITASLASRGIILSTGRGENSGSQAIVIGKSGYEGGADPRREGIARGF